MKGTVTFEGCPLSYEVRGEGPPVVLINGVGIHGSGCNPQIAELSRGFRCLTFDNRGIGASQPAGKASAICVDQMTRDTLAVMDELGMERAHVAGHSLGGVVAQNLALTARHRVRSLSLLCTSARGADALRLSPALIWRGICSNVGTRNSRRLAFLRIVMADRHLATVNRDELARELAVVIGHDLGDPPAVTNRQLSALRRFDSRARLSTLAGIPALVVAATDDVIFPPRFGRALAAGIPGARFVELEGAHGVTIQHADIVNRLLREHFDSAACFEPTGIGQSLPRTRLPFGMD